jgi:hypothetical protein
VRTLITSVTTAVTSAHVPVAFPVALIPTLLLDVTFAVLLCGILLIIFFLVIFALILVVALVIRQFTVRIFFLIFVTTSIAFRRFTITASRKQLEEDARAYRDCERFFDRDRDRLRLALVGDLLFDTPPRMARSAIRRRRSSSRLRCTHVI